MKKILMLSSSWGSEYSRAIIEGIQERFSEEEDGWELHIFNAYDDHQDYKYYEKDMEIYSLPIIEDYDGLVFAFSSIKFLKEIDAVARKFAKLNKPVISLDNVCDYATFCGLDNYRSMYKLVEHMITIHDCRTLNYVGGPENHGENKERFRAYCDCLNAHGITVDPKRVLHKEFMITDGAEAYEEFKKIDYHMPDAVICANDKMAMGYTDAAIKDGILVPNYLKVTGFDNNMDAENHSPSITSVNRNWRQLGIDAADTLIDEIDGKIDTTPRYTEGSLCYNESCGCERMRNLREDFNLLTAANNHQGYTGAVQMHVRQDLIYSRSADEFLAALKKGQQKLNYPDIAVCINKKVAELGTIYDYKGFDDEYDMFYDSDRLDSNRQSMLYPPEWKEKGENTFVFSPLHYCGCTMGYSVIPYRGNFFSRVKLRTLNEGISIAMGNILMRITITSLEEKLKQSE